jgi:hypothetical protein
MQLKALQRSLDCTLPRCAVSHDGSSGESEATTHRQSGQRASARMTRAVHGAHMGA